MKKKNNNKIALIVGSLILSSLFVFAQNSTKTTPELMLDLKYNLKNNQAPYILVHSKTKMEKKKFQSVPDISVSVYLDKQADNALIGKLSTNNNGDGAVFIPPSLKSDWDSSETHTFLALSEAKRPYAEATAELKITKARISIDTANEDGARSVIIKVEALSSGKWAPVKDVELKASVKRLGGDLGINDKATFTTDSLGEVKGEFKRDSIPGDANGNIVLVAKAEDNDAYGNLSIEKTVKWGASFKYISTFDERSLFATRDKAPRWLIFIASLIITIVWGTVIYLIMQIFEIRKLGRNTS